ncbi:hypothetical protein GCM10010340_14080 [Streptomyces griseoloalbus]|nr:hypothetical protein GCM10010340_14080 [Streptomyces albaduncus]
MGRGGTARGDQELGGQTPGQSERQQRHGKRPADPSGRPHEAHQEIGDGNSRRCIGGQQEARRRTATGDLLGLWEPVPD